MIVYKSRRFAVRRYQYGGSGIVSTIGSLLAQYATRSHAGSSCKDGTERGSLNACIKHVKNICRKASKKLHALYRVCKYITQNQRKVIMKAFIESQFGYCPLVWAFHGNRTLNNTINGIQVRALRLVYIDYHSSYDELLKKDGSYRNLQRNLQRLATEIYKFKHNLGHEISNTIFEPKLSSYNTRSYNIVHTRAV